MSVLTEIVVNGHRRRVRSDPSESLLSTLRDQLGLTGAKLACGRGECGACTVLIGEVPRYACITLTVLIDDEVTTVEGLTDEMQQFLRSLADEGGFQCGFCTPGQVVRAAGLLRTAIQLDENAIRKALSGNVCRCTGYEGIVRAIAKAMADNSCPRDSGHLT